jgi:hypothetical protein
MEAQDLGYQDANYDRELVENADSVADFGRRYFREERRDHAETQACPDPYQEARARLSTRV